MIKKNDYSRAPSIPRSITLKYDGEEIRPGQAFEILYSGLDPLIDAVVDSYTARGRKEKMEARYKIQRELETGKGIGGSYLQWVRWANKKTTFGLDATITLDDNSVRKYVLFPRTNFDAEGLKKRPSIIWLRNVEGGHPLVLREARMYNLDSFVAPFVRNTYGNKFDLDCTRQFYRDSEIDVVASSKPAGVLFIPEPQLLAGLEQMLKEDIWIDRLTPQPFVVDHDADTMWYLRHNISTLVADVSPTMEDLGNFYGQMQALGVIEELDRQMIHYGYAHTGQIVNYDPDFMVHSTSDRLVRQRDFDDLREVMKIDAKNLLLSFDLIKKAIDSRRKLAEEAGITKTTLLEYLPRTVTAEPFEKVELNK